MGLGIGYWEELLKCLSGPPLSATGPLGDKQDDLAISYCIGRYGPYSRSSYLLCIQWPACCHFPDYLSKLFRPFLCVKHSPDH